MHPHNPIHIIARTYQIFDSNLVPTTRIGNTQTEKSPLPFLPTNHTAKIAPKKIFRNHANINVSMLHIHVLFDHQFLLFCLLHATIILDL